MLMAYSCTILPPFRFTGPFSLFTATKESDPWLSEARPSGLQIRPDLLAAELTAMQRLSFPQ